MRKQFCQLPQLQILGTEVMPPLRYAVGFVNREQRDIQRAQEVQHALLHQTLWCQVEHFYFASTNTPGKLTLLLGTQGGVERSRRHTQLIERGHLVFHQRNQR
ncbi:hypothetical protein D3C77_650540 [compost metagenome]